MGDFRDKELLYGSLVMDAVIMTVAVYFVVIKSCKRFEWTILSCMFLKYALYAFGTTKTYFNLQKEALRGDNVALWIVYCAFW